MTLEPCPTSFTFETHGHGALKKITYAVTIDAIDAHLLKSSWRVSKGGYVVKSGWVNGKTKQLRLHREILGLTDPSLTVDHIDGNPLNNTRNNLRICTQAENSRNSRPALGKTSKYKGVSFYKLKGNWTARIMLGEKQIFLGYFQLEHDAAIAYNAACLKYHGAFARPNVLAEGES